MKKSSETLRRMLAIALCVTTLGSAGIMTEVGTFVGLNTSVSAADLVYSYVNIGNFQYNLYSDGTATMREYVGTNKDYSTSVLSVPSSVSYDGTSYTVTKIFGLAFDGCKIKELDLPYTLKEIGGAMSGASNIYKGEIGSFWISSSNQYFSTQSGVLYDKAKTTLLSYPTAPALAGNTSATVRLDAIATKVGRCAFENSTVKDLTLPDTFTNADSYAFYYSNLTKVTFESSLEDFSGILRDVFLNAKKLSSINIKGTNGSYSTDSYGVVYNKDKTTLMYCPEGRTSAFSVNSDCKEIANYAFKNSNAVPVIYDNVTKFNYQSFGSVGENFKAYCLKDSAVESQLKAWKIDYTYIYEYQFNSDNTGAIITKYNGPYTVPSMPATILGKPVVSIGDSAFMSNTKLQGVYGIPSTVTSVGVGAFSGCTSLKNISLPNSVKTIGNSAFYGCSNLTSLTIGSGVKTIGGSAFCNTGLTSQYIPKTVTSIGSYAFGYTYSDSKYSRNSSFTEISGYPGTAAQTYCKNYDVPFKSILQYSTSSDGKSIKIDKYTGTDTVVVIPDKIDGLPVTSIAGYAFNGTNVTSITLPSGMTALDGYALYGASKLTTVKFPSGITSIGSYAFEFCTSLKSITIPNTVTSIGTGAFYGCNSLSSVNLGTGMKTIGKYAFTNTALTSVTIPKSTTSIGEHAFGYTYSNSVYTAVSGFKMTGYAYTAADTYAANNSHITFTPLYESISNTSTISKTAITLGDSITINFASTGGKKPMTYAAMYSLNGGSSVSICSYSTNTSTTFTPTKAGTYTIYTYAKDDRGQFVAKTFTLTVDTPAVQNTSTISTTSINAGDTITVKASATGGNGSYQYSAAYRDVNTSTWTTVQLLGGNSNINFTIPASGKYEVSVQAADSDGKKEYKYFTVTVYDKLVNASEINAETAIVGDEIIINASATGGSGGYTYKFSYTRDGISYWADATGSGAICTFIPNYADTYHYKVVVTDSNGKTDEKVFDVVVEEPQRELVNTSTVSDTEITLGNRVYVTPSAEGGAGNYTYAVLYKKKTDTKWVTKQNFSANTENISVLPSMAADYEICVKVQDGDGNIVKKFFEVKVVNAAQPLTNNSTLSSLTITKGETITVTASAQGGEGDYLYQVVYKKKTDTKWATAQNFAANNVVTIKPASAVDYDVCVKVKDANGDIVKKFFDVTVTEAVELTNNSIMSASTIVKGNTVTLTGIAAGGSGSYTYAFLYKKKTDTKWTTKQGFAENNTVDIKPASAVDYDVCIKVQDSKGTIVKKFFDLTVTQALASNSTISATSITKGQTVTVNCAATGGEAPYAYAVYYKKNADTKWTTKQNFTDNAEVIVKPANATTYDICVKVKDCTGTVAKQYFTVEVK